MARGVQQQHGGSRRGAGQDRQPGGPRLQEEDQEEDATRCDDRQPAPGSPEEHHATQAPRQDEGEDAGVEIHARHQPRDLLHRPAGVETQAQLADDLGEAHRGADESGHDDHSEQLFLPSRYDRQKQAGQAEREPCRQRPEDVGEAGGDVDRNQERPAGDQQVAGEERDDRFSQHREVEKAADPRQAHDDDRHQQEDQHRQQAGNQRDVDGGIVDEAVEDDQHEAEERQECRVAGHGLRGRSHLRGRTGV